MHVVGKVLGRRALGVEANYECFIETGAHRVLQKIDGGILLEIKTAVHRSAHIDEQAKVQRQIGLAAEINNRLRGLVIVKDGEIFFIQVAHKLAMFVGGNKQHVYFIDPFMNGEQRPSLRIVFSG